MVQLVHIRPDRDVEVALVGREPRDLQHVPGGQSETARALLVDFDTAVERFGKVMPKDFKRVLAAQAAAERDGRDINEAIMEAAHG
jgi:glutamate synthase (NADPH/NADH) large chain